LSRKLKVNVIAYFLNLKLEKMISFSIVVCLKSAESVLALIFTDNEFTVR